MDHLNNVRFKRVGGWRFVIAAFHSLPLFFCCFSCSPNCPPAGAALLIFTLPSEAVCVFVHASSVHGGKFAWLDVYVQWMVCTEVRCVCVCTCASSEGCWIDTTVAWPKASQCLGMDHAEQKAVKYSTLWLLRHKLKCPRQYVLGLAEA